MTGMGNSAPLVVHEAVCEPLDGERVVVRLRGEWLAEPPPSVPLVLGVVGSQGPQQFPAIPQPRQTVGPGARDFEAGFMLPGALAGELAALTLYAGETEIPVPPAHDVAADEPEPPPLAVTAPRGPEEPLRAELASRARSEARLRAELAQLRAVLEHREAAGARVGALTDELSSELERVRSLVTTEADRRREVESRSMVLAAELTAAQSERDEARADAQALRAERAELIAQVESLRRELATIQGELAGARSAEDAAVAAREAAATELEALRDEVDRLGAERGERSVIGDGSSSELARAEALLAEARALRSSYE